MTDEELDNLPSTGNAFTDSLEGDPTAYEASKEADPERLMALASTAAKKRAELRVDPSRPVVSREVTATLEAAGFQFIRTEQDASGYAHTNGRAILVERTGAWTLLANGLESGGATVDTLLEELAKPAPKKLSKKVVRINTARALGEKSAAAIKAGKKYPAPKMPTSPVLALEIIHEAETEATKKRAAKVVAAVPGMPPNVVRAVEMLASLTDGKFNLHDLRGEKNYGHRLALLKKLFDRERVLVAETGVNNLIQAFHSAIGVGIGSYAVQDVDFADRCKVLLAKVDAVRYAAAKVAKKSVRAVKRAVAPALIVPGIIQPIAKPLNKARLKRARAEELTTLQAELDVPRFIACPRPSVTSLVHPLEARNFRLLTHVNKLVSLKLERWNSQGALHVWPSETGRIVSGVLTPILAQDVKTQPQDLVAILELVTGWLNAKSVKQDPGILAALVNVQRAIARVTEPITLAVTGCAVDARDNASEPKITATSTRLLEDPATGAVVLLQLERENSQGALAVYNNGSRVGVGVVPSEILKILRPVTSEVNLATAASQLLNPSSPSVPVTPTAARHLTTVKEIATMATKKSVLPASEEKPKKFAAKTATAPAKPVTKKSVKLVAKTAEPATERKSSLFRLRNEAKATWSAFKTQKAEIVTAFVELGAVGAKAVGVTRAALIAALPAISDKNISFYLSVWQKEDPAIVEKLAAAE